MTKRKAEPYSRTANGASKTKRVALDVRNDFRSGLFAEDVLEKYKVSYANSAPYRHGVISDLIDQSLLRAVRDEIRNNILFTPKETDIYKIHQSGDLANLDGLDEASLKLLPSLARLRDALYSPQFRSYLGTVTNAGALSGVKTDMAVNVYTPGCHLLCHDDVIGSRRVSYILYLTDPDKPWQPEWGGALRLFPTKKVKSYTSKEGSKRSNGQASEEFDAPLPHHTLSIPPAFNQLSFFAVQPGLSFHDVEEVYARTKGSDNEDGGRVRMAISGWFHIPQPGEDGFVPGAEEAQAQQSSLAQLKASKAVAASYDLPQPQWTSYPDANIPANGAIVDEDTELSEEDLSLLIQYMNPQYLTPDAVEELAERFEEESCLQLGAFLFNSFAAKLKAEIAGVDGGAGITDEVPMGWKIARPPHKQRYLFRQPSLASTAGTAVSKATNKESAISAVVDRLFPSLAFRKWLALATGLELSDCNVLARRFRRGMDYTLATSYDDEEPQLEICLGISPSRGWDDAAEETEDGEQSHVDPEEIRGSSGHVDPSASAPITHEDGPEGGVGGYEMYMTGDDEEENGEDEDGDSDHGVIIPSSHTGAGNRKGAGKPRNADPAIYRAAAEDEDDGVLFTMPAGWNVMSVVLRDRGTLRFTKYVSRSAPGDRWDICGEWKVEADDDDDDDDQNAEE